MKYNAGEFLDAHITGEFAHVLDLWKPMNLIGSFGVGLIPSIGSMGGNRTMVTPDGMTFGSGDGVAILVSGAWAWEIGGAVVGIT